MSRAANRLMLATCALTMGALTACTSQSSPAPTLEGIGDARFAVVTSVTNHDSGGGALLLVSADGTVRRLATEQMDSAKPTWTRNGIVFADTKYLYRIGDSVQRTPLATRGIQYDPTESPDRQRVGIYFNDGREDGGYMSGSVQVGPSIPERMLEEEGFHQATADCGSAVAVISQLDPHLAARRDVKPLVPRPHDSGAVLQLRKIRPDGQPDEAITAKAAITGIPLTVGFGAVPCSHGTIRAMGGLSTDSGGQFVRLTWNIQTGKYTLVKLRGPATAQFGDGQLRLARGLPNEDPGGAWRVFDGWNGNVYQVAADGTTTLEAAGPFGDTRTNVALADDYRSVYMLATNRGESMDGEVWRYDVTHHRWESVLKLPGFSRYDGRTGPSSIHGFDVRPAG